MEYSRIDIVRDCFFYQFQNGKNWYGIARQNFERELLRENASIQDLQNGRVFHIFKVYR